MSETLHLQRRGSTWHYYRRTPPHLASVIGRRFFKYSLKTSNLAKARRLRTVEDLKLDALFSAAADKKAAACEISTDRKATVSLDTLIDYVRKHVSEVDKRRKTHLQRILRQTSRSAMRCGPTQIWTETRSRRQTTRTEPTG